MASNNTFFLRDACSKIGSGATPRGGRESYKGGATTLIRSQNVYNESFRRDGLVYIDDTQAAELSNVDVKPHDVLLNITGDSVARCCQVAPDVLPARVNQHVAIIRPRPETLDPRYLRYVLVSQEFQAHLLALASAGATRNALTKAMIEGLAVPAPPIPKQKAVAHILGSLDDKIELNRRMNETLEGMACTLFKSWFIDFDPVRAKADGRMPTGMNYSTALLFPDSFHTSELGEIPRGWAVSKLASLTTKIGSGATPRGGNKVYLPHGIVLIRSQNVYDNEFLWDGLARISDHAADELRNVAVQRNDVLINITGDSILRTCVVDPNVLPARVNQHVSIIRAKESIPPRFIHQFLVMQQTKDVLLGFDSGGSRKAVTKGHLESLPILLSNHHVLTRFAELTDPFFDRVTKNSAATKTLSELRDALLPKLLSGELRIKDAERFVEASL
jgi:type I restriction enzyme, S subunit